MLLLSSSGMLLAVKPAPACASEKRRVRRVASSRVHLSRSARVLHESRDADPPTL